MIAAAIDTVEGDSMAAQKEKKDQRFDQAKLQGMHEPLSVRVEKMRGNVRQPIELPPKGNDQSGYSPPGTGWTRDEVLGMENFILTKWAGGGYYEFTVTDAKGDQMAWSGVWDPRMYPERVPPNTAEAALLGAATNVMPQMAGPQTVPVVAQPLGMQTQSGWPPSSAQLGYGNPPFSGPVMGAPQAAPVGTPPAPAPAPSQAPPMWAQPWSAGPMGPMGPQGPVGPWGYAMQPSPWGFPPQGYGMPPGYGSPYGYSRGPRFEDEETRARRARLFDQDDSEKRESERREAEKRDLEQKLRQAELNQKEMEYKATLERIQQQQQAQMAQQAQVQAQQVAAMQEEIRRLAEGRGKGEDDEVRRMREERQRERDAAQAEQQRQREQAAADRAILERQIADQQLAQIKAQADAQIQLLRDQIARMNEQPRGETDEIRQLRQEQERQAREFERQRQEDQRRLELERHERERERERAERERREEQLAREMRDQQLATERRFEQLMSARNASDPMIDALKETSRMNAEQMREMARMQQAQSDKMAAFMVAPAQLAAIMKDNSTGADGVMRGMIQSIGEIGNLYKNAAQSVMEMSGGGGEPPAVRLIQEGMARAGEVAERFLAVKRDSVISEAKVKQAEAARDQTKIQAEAQLRSQQMYTQAQAQRWSPPPPVAGTNGNVASGGLGGARPAQPQQAQPQQAQQAQQQQPQAAVPQPNNGQAPQPRPKSPPGTMIEYVEPEAAPKPSGMIEYVEPPAPPTRTGPTEEEVFGMALESVHRLRRGVAAGTLTPEKTIDAILMGVEHVVSKQLVIPAFVLYQQERWADFIDLMIPDADQDFRTECVRILVEETDTEDPADPEPSSALVPSSAS